jgi:Mn-dependent DtxR family transcriptional regulator
MRLTESLENYLKTILILKERLGMVRSKDVADELGFSKPSVSHAVSLLKKGGLIYIGGDNALELTEEGRKYAEVVLGKYVVVSDFLLKTLGVDARTAGEDACRLEHAFSEQSFNRLKNFTNLSRYPIMEGGNING